jgi:hypothetical protein
MGVRRCLPLARVLALVGGLTLVAAFFMPWFSSQGLLLSGQFLHTFLSSAAPADLRRFVPNVSPSEAVQLRVLVDLFPVAGAVAALASLVGGLLEGASVTANVVVVLAGVVPLLAWAGGITRLPAGAQPEIGLWLVALGSVAVLLGAALEVLAVRRVSGGEPVAAGP